MPALTVEKKFRRFKWCEGARQVDRGATIWSDELKYIVRGWGDDSSGRVLWKVDERILERRVQETCKFGKGFRNDPCSVVWALWPSLMVVPGSRRVRQRIWPRICGGGAPKKGCTSPLTASEAGTGVCPGVRE